MRPLFIVLEGINGAGKTTQARLLTQFLRDKHRQPVELNDPPHHGPEAEIRRLLVTPEIKLENEQLALLYSAARIGAAREASKAMDHGHDVVGSRWVLSTLAYQGHTLGCLPIVIRAIHHNYVRLDPDLTILLDIPEDVAWERSLRVKAAGLQAGEQDRFERQGKEFAARLRAGYLKEVEIIQAKRNSAELEQEFSKDPQQPYPAVATIDATGSVSEVFLRVLAACRSSIPTHMTLFSEYTAVAR